MPGAVFAAVENWRDAEIIVVEFELEDAARAGGVILFLPVVDRGLPSLEQGIERPEHVSVQDPGVFSVILLRVLELILDLVAPPWNEPAALSIDLAKLLAIESLISWYFFLRIADVPLDRGPDFVPQLPRIFARVPAFEPRTNFYLGTFSCARAASTHRRRDSFGRLPAARQRRGVEAIDPLLVQYPRHFRRQFGGDLRVNRLVQPAAQPLARLAALVLFCGEMPEQQRCVELVRHSSPPACDRS